MMSLDLILTIDTMVAHLAGALGIPVWTMLHADCDWRWPKTGRQSIWTPDDEIVPSATNRRLGQPPRTSRPRAEAVRTAQLDAAPAEPVCHHVAWMASGSDRNRHPPLVRLSQPRFASTAFGSLIGHSSASGQGQDRSLAAAGICSSAKAKVGLRRLPTGTKRPKQPCSETGNFDGESVTKAMQTFLTAAGTWMARPAAFGLSSPTWCSG